MGLFAYLRQLIVSVNEDREIGSRCEREKT